MTDWSDGGYIFCDACRAISLSSLLKTTQTYEANKRSEGCGVPLSYPLWVSRMATMSFKNPKNSSLKCSLCSFVFSIVSRAKGEDPDSIELALAATPLSRYHYYYHDTMKYGFLRGEPQFDEFDIAAPSKYANVIETISSETIYRHTTKIQVAALPGLSPSRQYLLHRLP
jgi:hypothetical protein